ncbi:MAG: beta-lactamase [Gemmatimonadetes bacterium]|nr:beta-lactamase [Gemmatimonadota bacterium]
MIMRRIAAAVLLLPALASAQARPATEALVRQVDSLAKAFVAAGSTPSVSISIVRGGNALVMGAWGKADVEQGVEATAASVYEIGSGTKQFTAAAIMQLIEQGKVKLEEPIATYLTGLPDAWRVVTVHQLLNHTSGIPNYTAVAAWAPHWAEEKKPDSLVAYSAHLPMDFAPGTKYKYDNQGYVLLGIIIERVTGKRWQDDFAERITKPLGLGSTRICDVGSIIPHRVRGYEKLNDTLVNAPYFSVSQAYAAGAICSTVGDMARWNRALHTGKVVSPASYRLMTTPDGAAAATRYGFGLQVDTIAGHTLISHGGNIPGFASANAWVADEELSVTVLSNAIAGNPGLLSRQVMRAALGLPPAPPVTRRPPSGAKE